MGFDISVKQAALVGKVESVAYRGGNFDDNCEFEAFWTVFQHRRRIGSGDVVHRDPQVIIELTPIVDSNDVWVPQACGYVRLAGESCAILTVGSER